MPEPDTRKRRLGRRTIAITIAVVMLAATVTWLAMARNTLTAVSVAPSKMSCDGKDVPATVVPDEFGETAPAPTFLPAMTPSSECWLTVVVSNGGSRSVHLSSMTFDAMMPGASGRFQLETPRNAFDETPREIDEGGDAIFDTDEVIDEGGDAIFDTDEVIEPGTWIELMFEIHYRDDAESCAGGRAGTSGFPTARVRGLGLSRDVTGSVNIAYDTVATEANRTNCG